MDLDNIRYSGYTNLRIFGRDAMKEAAMFFRVLADEARLQILWLLFNHEELCVCDIMAVLEITQSKASRHLRILFNAGLVSDRRDAVWIHYSLRPPADEFARAFLETLRAQLGGRKDAAALMEKLSATLAEKEQVRCGERGLTQSRERSTGRIPRVAPLPGKRRVTKGTMALKKS
jgi:ArsR family transcriptional regulator